MKIPSLQIGDLVARVPIIQGGMGIGVSRANLASAVANEGGIGIISGVQIGFKEKDFNLNPLKANIRALKKDIQKAKEKSPQGIIGVNLMVAMRNFKEYVQAAVEENIDILIAGAGLPLDLPKLVKDSTTKIIPIVSSAKAASLILRRWKKLNRIPDAIIVEGPLAGGHLGFKAEDMHNRSYQTLEKIIPEVLNTVRPFAELISRPIPIIAAGGIFNGFDIAKFLSLGASGVQMGTRFVATEECDADISFKMAYINATEQDVRIIKSPVGLPGRAIQNGFLKNIDTANLPVKRCWQCIKHCQPAETPYCISQALIDSVLGREGLIFCGARVGEINKIVTVKELMSTLTEELEQASINL